MVIHILDIPLACAAGLATLEVYEDEKLFQRAGKLEKYLEIKHIVLQN